MIRIVISSDGQLDLTAVSAMLQNCFKTASIKNMTQSLGNQDSVRVQVLPIANYENYCLPAMWYHVVW